MSRHRALREKVLRTIDEGRGHCSGRTTLSLVWQRFRGLRVRWDANEFVRCCGGCQLGGPVCTYGGPTTQPFSGIFCTWPVHFAGPVSKTKSSNHYACLGVEHLTSRAILKRTKKQTVAVPTRVFETQIVLNYGSPKVLVSGNGPAFRARAFKDGLRNVECEWRPVPANMPQSNGRAQCILGTMEAAIPKVLASEGANWGSETSHVETSYRMRRSGGDTYSAFPLVCGVESGSAQDESLVLETEAELDTTPKHRGTRSRTSTSEEES